MFFSSGDGYVGEMGMSGNFLSCLKGVKYPFEAQEGMWDFS